MRAGAFYRELESVRGLAALTVMLYHLTTFGKFQDATYALVSRVAYSAVEIALIAFFVLSAFVLVNALSSDAERQGRTWAVLSRYAVRRFFRIYPLVYFVTVGAFTFFFFWSPAPDWYGISIREWFPSRYYSDFRPDVLMSNLLLVSKTFNPVGWTLVCEMAGYCIIPFVWLAIESRGYARVAAVAAVVALHLAFTRWSYIGIWYDVVGPFAAGIGLWYIHRLLSPKWRVAVIAAMAGLFIVAATRWQAGPFEFSTVTAAGIALVFLGIIRLPARNIFTVAPLRWLGRVSYSLYLLHYPVLFALVGATTGGMIEVRDPVQFAIIGVFGVVLTFLLSQISYSLIERPFINVGAALSAVTNGRESEACALSSLQLSPLRSQFQHSRQRFT